MDSMMPIAVVGLGCRMPGADNLDEFWEMILNRRDGIVEFPADRFDRSLYYDPQRGILGKGYSQLGGIIPERPFDSRLCPLPDDLVRKSDPAHLLMCEVVAEACRHAGMDIRQMPYRNTGVYIGHTGGTCLAGELAYTTYIEEVTEYLKDIPGFQRQPSETQSATIRDIIERVHREKPNRQDLGFPNLGASALPALIARALDLSGPMMAIDAACASSLIAMANGVQALMTGDIDMAVVGGASHTKWYGLVLFSQAQSLSGTGTRPFDTDADGLISSDGYAAVILKTLPRALADGDAIHGVIRGIGISSDGRGKSLWAPRKEGQITAINRAYADTIDPQRLQFIECHATSTQVGDATELAALSQALKEKLPPGAKIPVGSVKGNIGHTLESAGIAGFVKTVMAMKHKTIPPQANFNTPNEEIDWQSIPFYVPSEPAPWPAPADGNPRRAAVNAFGIGGLNIHVVIDDAPTAAELNSFSGSPGSASVEDAHRNLPTDDDAVAIVGLAAILPGALTVDALWDLLLSGRDPKSEVPSQRWNAALYHAPGANGKRRVETTVGGYITDFVYDWKKHKVPPKQIANSDPLQFMLLDAADQALRNAGLHDKEFDRSMTSVVVGTIFTGDFACQMQMGLRLPEYKQMLKETLLARGVSADQLEEIAETFSEVLLQRMPALHDETGSFTSSTLASRLTKTFNFMGGGYAIDSGDNSSLMALSSAVNLLRTGNSDMVLCASGQRSLGIDVYESLGLRGYLPQQGAKSSLDAQFDGFVPGEGVGVVVLKRLSDARRDGDQIRGVIRGIGAASDFASTETAAATAMERAFHQSDITPTEVGVIEDAGVLAVHLEAGRTSVPTAKLHSSQRKQPMLLGSMTSQIGHLTGASGMASLVKATLELENGQVPGNFGLTTPAESISSTPQIFYAGSVTQKLSATTSDGKCVAAVTTVDEALCSASCLLLEGGENLPQAAEPAKPGYRMFRLGSSTLGDLQKQMEQLKTDDVSTLRAATLAAFDARHRCRLAVVYDTPETLQRKLALAAARINDPAARAALEQQGIYCSPTDQTVPRIAFVFPGQGSQYVGMLKDVIAQIPAAAAKLQEIDETLKRMGYPSFAEIAWNDQGKLGTDVWLTQLSVLLSDVIMHAAVTSLGVHPDVICGHSYGEFPALVAAGSLNLEQAILATRARADAIRTGCTTPGQMLSTTASAAVVSELLDQCGGQVYLANDNAPNQTVVGGTPEGIAAFKNLLDARGVKSQLLAVPSAFHTPLMSQTQEPFRRALQAIDFQSPQNNFCSSVTNNVVTAPGEIRENLVSQMTSPVRFVELIQKLAADGSNIVIEVGPKAVLAGLVQRILPEGRVSVIATDFPKRDSEEQWLRLQALLECAGVLGEQKPQSLVTSSTQQTQQPGSSPSKSDTTMPANTPKTHGSISSFDATLRRKQKMRRSAEGAPPQPVPTPAAPKLVATPAAVVTQPVQPAAPAPSRTESTPARAEMAAFMIEYIVDQTGYPEEMVELDADLEADLGIDSIKKAQLLGELAENYSLDQLAASVGDLSLDDFPTLNSILEFLGSSEGSPAVETSAKAVEVHPATTVPPVIEQKQTITPPITTEPTASRGELAAFMIEYIVDQTGYPEEMVELDADLEADLGIDSIKKAQLLGELSENFELGQLAGSVGDLSLDDFPTLNAILDFLGSVGEPVSSETATVAPSVVEESSPLPSPTPPVNAAPTPVANSQIARSELAAFMVEYIVDQTGYPAEMVELEADLEADLGIDSIKKAQLLGELVENFELSHLSGGVGDLSLDDFPTLSAMLDFLESAEGQPISDTAALVTAVAPEESVSVPLPTVIEELLPDASVPEGTGASRDELAVFMVDYIVDQTGYPPEMVELDADLEADLGIDSIKKAQLLGELAENFDLRQLAGSVGDLSLDDFPTLTAILDFLQAAEPPATAESNGQESQPQVTDATPVKEQAVISQPPAPPSDSELIFVHCSGTPFEMGFQHGQQQARQIQTILDRHAALLGSRLYNMPELDEAIADPLMYFGEVEVEELKGIAAGMDQPFESLLAHNLGLYPDYVPGCTQFATTARRNPPAGMIHAANEDSPLSLSLPDSLTRVIEVRHPNNGIPHITFGISGQMSGLNGINAKGLAVTSTLLLDRPRRTSTAKGMVHPVLVKRVLESADCIEAAIDVVRELDRVGAWSMCLSHWPTDRLCYLEYDGAKLEVRYDEPVVSATNHCSLQPPLFDVPQHSVYRLQRLRQVLGWELENDILPQTAQEILRDRYDLGRQRETKHPTMNTVRRVDNQVSIVMQPASGSVWATPGPTAKGNVDRYYHFNVNELLSTKPTVATSHPIAKPDEQSLPTLPGTDERLMERFVLRMVESPLPAVNGTVMPLSGPVVVLGQNSTSEALAAYLASRDVRVYELSTHHSVDETLEELDRIWTQAPVTHLFVMTGSEENSPTSTEGAVWNALEKQHLLLPYLVCQRWAQRIQEAGMEAEAALVAVTSLGGDFGFSGRTASVAGGALGGLFKAIQREIPKLTVKVIDVPREEPADTIVKAISDELDADLPNIEVGYVHGKRHVPQPVFAPVEGRKGMQPQRGETWVVSGGARGVTAIVAQEIGRRFGLKMHLLGTTPVPEVNPAWRDLSDEETKQLKRKTMSDARERGDSPLDVWRGIERAIEVDKTLRSFAAAGVDTTYHAVSVTDRDALSVVLQQIRRQSGPIAGIIHGAGVEAASRFDRKKRQQVEATFAVKVDGAAALIELTREDPLRYFIGFGSVSGRFGGLGQTDYSMASDMLCKMCGWLRSVRPDCAAVGIHWPPWADVGMAVRPESKLAIEAGNMTFMPPLEGAAHVIDEVCSGADESEVVFFDQPTQLDQEGIWANAHDVDPQQPFLDLGDQSPWQSARAFEKPTEATSTDPVSLGHGKNVSASVMTQTSSALQQLVSQLPLVEAVRNSQPEQTLTAEMRFDPTTDLFLEHHRLNGRPLLPAVVGLEALFEAASLAADGRQVVELQDVKIRKGMSFRDQEPQNAIVTVNCDARQAECQLLGGPGQDVVYQSTVAVYADSATDLEAPPLDEAFLPYNAMVYADEKVLIHGPTFQTLQELSFQRDSGWGHLVAKSVTDLAPARSGKEWTVPAPILDGCIMACGVFTFMMCALRVEIPAGFDRVQFGEMPKIDEQCTVRFWMRDQDQSNTTFDFILYGEDGRAILRVDGYRGVRIGGGK